MKTFRQKIKGEATSGSISSQFIKFALANETRASTSGAICQPPATVSKYLLCKSLGEFRKERSRKTPRRALAMAAALASLATILIDARSNHPASESAMAIVRGSSPVAHAAHQI